MRRLMVGIASGAILLWGGCEAPVETTPELRPGAEKVIYLVRHAEKVTGPDAGDDPALTPAGEVRADALVNELSDKGLTKIYSSPYQRTWDTAAPIAAQAGLPIIEYDPRDLPALKVRLMAECGVCLVVGHSNTTPPLAELLGADPGTPINEAGEYDRLYEIVIRPKDGEDGANVTGKILRYGAAYTE